jgi:cyclopropane fatty-acyl-phospholipid synthase-like methyltransferase
MSAVEVSSTQLIANVQDAISACLPGSGYVKDYRAEEVGYWSSVPAWIDQMPQGISVLDIGCAYGTLALYARKRLNADVLAVDAIEQSVIRQLLAEHGIRYAKCNIELDSLPAGQFDLVIFTEAVEHLNFHPVPTLTKIRESLRPGGLMALSTPDASSAWGRALTHYKSLAEIPEPEAGKPWIDGHVWQYTFDELFDVLRRAGFRIQESRYSSRPIYRHFNVLARRSF